MTTTAERMYTLFLGSDRAHGTYQTEEKLPGKLKSEIKKTARTLRTPASVELWERHLTGKTPLGVIPIRSDGTVCWGAIDVDKYDDLSHKDIVQKLISINVPMVVCRSKSGGAHLFLFVESFVSAELLVTKLRSIAAVLGYGGSEIFPKQTTVLKNEHDLGNWLNMPYFNSNHTERYGFDLDGRSLSLSRFLDFAESRRLSASQLYELSPATSSDPIDEIIKKGPPCLEILARNKVQEGGRNNALFAFGVLARKAFPENNRWKDRVLTWNGQYFSPSLPYDEVNSVIENLKKGYNYPCTQPPMCSFCDKSVCGQREFGIDTGMISIESLDMVMTDPVQYLIRMTSGEVVTALGPELNNPAKFEDRLMSAGIDVNMPKKKDWKPILSRLMGNATRIAAPPEASPAGIFKELLNDFLQENPGGIQDDIGQELPWDDGEYVHFKFTALTKYLQVRNFKSQLTTGMMYNIIREMGGMGGGDSDVVKIRGKTTRIWKVPSNVVNRQTESFEVPRAKDAPI